MIYEQLTIRTKDQLKTAKKAITDALLIEAASKSKKQFPLFYKYIESNNPNDHPKKTDRIGTISCIEKDSHGNITGTVQIYDYIALAKHFVGVIDNISVSLIKSDRNGYQDLKPALSYGIVYDKFVKQTIDAKKNVSIEKTRVRREGDLPEADYVTRDTDDNPLRDPKIMDDLHKLMEKEMGKEVEQYGHTN